MSLYVVREGERFVWLAALLGEDVYTYVPNTGRFHLNEGLREDYFMTRDLQYEEITAAKAQALIEAGIDDLDEDLMEDSLARWRSAPEQLAPDQVYAASVADLQ